MEKYECHPVKSLAPLLVSAPLFVSFYFAISRMADGIGSFKDGEAFWFTDLSARGSNHDDASVDVRFIFSLGRVRCRRRYEQQSTRPDHEVGTPRISLSFSADDVELYSRRVLLLDHEQLVFALPGDFVQVYDDEKISRHSRYLSLGELRFQPVEPKSQFG